MSNPIDQSISERTDGYGLDRVSEGLSTKADRLTVVASQAPIVIGSGSLPHAGKLDSYELPAAVGKSDVRPVQLRLRTRQPAGSRVFQRRPVMPFPEMALKEQRRAGTTIGGGPDAVAHAVQVLESFRFYGEALRNVIRDSLVEPSCVHKDTVFWMPSTFFLQKVAIELHSEDAPPVLPIVRVQQRLQSPLRQLAEGLRRQLRRERERVQVGLVESIDTQCIEWLARQPGKNLLERAGPRQEILAVVRKDTVDTYENRILKQCLQLIVRETRMYVRAFDQQFQGHERIQEVKQFGKFALSMLGMPELVGLPEPSDTTRPNYVLQYGENYCDIWWAYEVLRRQRRETEDLWKWRHRVCGELLALDFAIAASQMPGVISPDADREIGLREDPVSGHWIHSGSIFPAQRIQRTSGSVVVEVRLPLHGVTPTEPADVSVHVTLEGSGESVLHGLAVAGGFDGADPIPNDGVPCLVASQGVSQIQIEGNLDPFPERSVGLAWPLRPLERTALATRVLERVIASLEGGSDR